MGGILIVDDEQLILDTLRDMLEIEGLGPVRTERDPKAVEDRINAEKPDVLLLDLTMPGRSGVDVMESVRSRWPDIPVIVVTGDADLESAISCMRAGASDYLIKAVDRTRLVTAVQRALDFRELERENRALRQHLLTTAPISESPFPYIITRDRVMLDLIAYARTIASSRRPLLILGETGTGKDLMARAVHESSGRTGPLVAANISGFDDAMFADTLFGHVKDAYTGANSARRGLVEQASGGTLFLDEIGDLSAISQVKLLRLLDSGEYRPVGSDTVQASQAVIVAATNRDLQDPDSGFRKDLYYRLSAHVIHLPSLGDRIGDIPDLVRQFVTDAATEFGFDSPPLGEDALDHLMRREFPGNVRELRSLVTDAVGRGSGRGLVIPELAGNGIGDGSRVRAGDGISWPEPLPSLREAGESLVSEAMRRSGGNQSAAARLLGISQPALNKRLRKPSLDS